MSNIENFDDLYVKFYDEFKNKTPKYKSFHFANEDCIDKLFIYGVINQFKKFKFTKKQIVDIINSFDAVQFEIFKNNLMGITKDLCQYCFKNKNYYNCDKCGRTVCKDCTYDKWYCQDRHGDKCYYCCEGDEEENNNTKECYIESINEIYGDSITKSTCSPCKTNKNIKEINYEYYNSYFLNIKPFFMDASY